MSKGTSRYVVGIDLGTTYTAVAVHTIGDELAPALAASGGTGGGAGGRWHMAELGTRSATIPSLVLLRDDGSVLVGEAAERRAVIEPGRVAREFKRRLGDSVPMLLGGTPFSAEQLTAKLLQHTLERVTELEGGPPAGMVLTHPANWGAFKLDTLRAAVRLAGHDPRAVTFISEPEAAALAYAAHDRPPDSARVIVYDLGGGTFDVAILEDRGERYALVGEPGGVERLGGIDFDEALFRHVLGLVEGAEQLDQNDPSVVADLVALRQSCVAAKEALSSETDATIAVRIGPIRDEIRVVRSEFEGLIRPTLEYTTQAMAFTIETAGLRPEDLHAVLLVGGSSRIPLVSQLISAELGRPVALDIHPKHAVALGAALVAAGTAPADVDRTNLPVVVISADGADQTDPYGPPPVVDPPDASTSSTAPVAPAGPPTEPTSVPASAPPWPAPTAAREASEGESAPAAPPPPTAPPPTSPPSDPAPTVVMANPFATPAAPNASPTAIPRRSYVDAPPPSGPPLQAPHPDPEPTVAPAPRPKTPRAGAKGGTNRWMSAVALGAFMGVVGLISYVFIKGNNDNAGPTTTTATTAETATSAAPPDSATSVAPTTSLLSDWTPTLKEFADHLSTTDGRLLKVGNQAELVVPICETFITQVGENYGAPPTDGSSQVPTLLLQDIALLEPSLGALTEHVFDLALQRYAACVRSDDTAYSSLQAQEKAARIELSALGSG